MRMVSWIVVVGALAWLLYAQLHTHVPEEELDGIDQADVSGSVGSADTAPPARTQSVTFTEPDSPVAVVPYAQVYPMIEVTRTVDELDRIEATTIVLSQDRSVRSEDILLFLDDGEQTYQFPVGQYGVVNLPARPEWRDQDLLLRSNQPEGTLSLRVSFIMRALPGTQVEYAWLWESVEQMRTAMMAMQKARVVPPGDVVGVIFEFEPGERGVLLAGDGNSQAELVADENGVLRLEMTPELLAANPTLVFSPMPQRMVPLLVPVEDTLDP